MVTVTNYLQRENAEGKTFFMLEITGDLEIMISEKTGKPYATIRKTTIPSTFDENMCKLMLGKQIQGSIIKVATEEPYTYIIKDTGEEIQLNHKYEYSLTDSKQSMEEAVFIGE